MPRRSFSQKESGWHVDISALRPILLNLLAETLTPKATRQQWQQQEALTALDRYAPHIRNLPEEEKEKFYGQFFRAHGVYHPPVLRGLFGAGPEPILPLPKGASVTKEPRPLMGGERTVYTIPSVEPLSFTRPEPSPLVHPKTKEEAERLADERGLVGEKRQEFLDRVLLKIEPEAVKAPTRDWEEKLINGAPMKRRIQFDPSIKSFVPVEGAEWIPSQKESTRAKQPYEMTEEEYEQYRKRRLDVTKEEERIKASFKKDTEKITDAETYFKALEKAYNEYANLKYREEGRRPSLNEFWWDDAWSFLYKQKWTELTGKEPSFYPPTRADVSAPPAPPYTLPPKPRLPSVEEKLMKYLPPPGEGKVSETPTPPPKVRAKKRFEILEVR